MHATIGRATTKEWTMADKMRFQDYLVALLYQHYPVRNDFIAQVIGRREYNKLTDSDTKATNYLVRDSKRVHAGHQRIQDLAALWSQRNRDRGRTGQTCAPQAAPPQRLRVHAHQ